MSVHEIVITLKCYGWSRPPHVAESVELILLPGCKFCGGSECDDYDDYIDLCPECMVEAKAAI